MKIAITPRFYENNLEKLISVEEKYYSFFSKYGMTVNLVPYQLSMLDEFFSNLNPDAVVFAGGYRMYTDEIKNFEKEVLKISLRRNYKILGICCGMWTINGYFNGTLKFDESHQCIENDKINLKKFTHTVESTELIEENIYNVNSFHSKVIDKIGDNLTPFLIAEDGTIEGFYDLNKKILGVQFHMENDGVSSKLTEQIMKKFNDL